MLNQPLGEVKLFYRVGTLVPEFISLASLSPGINTSLSGDKHGNVVHNASW